MGDTAKGSEDTVSTQGTVEINDSGPRLSNLEQEEKKKKLDLKKNLKKLYYNKKRHKIVLMN